MVERLRVESPVAVAALCERYGAHVLSVLARILGGDDAELPDLHHDALLRAVRSAKQIQDPAALRGWLSIIAVNVARTALQRRSRRRWLRFLPWRPPSSSRPQPHRVAGVDHLTGGGTPTTTSEGSIT